MARELFKQEFKYEMMGFKNLPEPEDFSICAWQTEKKVLIGWVYYRFILFLYYFVTLVYGIIHWVFLLSGSDQIKILLRFGFWAHVLKCHVNFWLFVGVLVDYLNQHNRKMIKRPDINIFLWWAYTQALPFTLTSTIIYWALVYDKRPFSDLGHDIIFYALSGFIFLIDFWLVAFPIRYLHFYILDVIVIVYLLTAAIYELAGGEGLCGQIPLYIGMNWPEKALNTFLWVFIAVVIANVTYFLVSTLSFWKICLRKKHITKKFDD